MTDLPLLDQLVAQMPSLLGANLVGIYLFGSLATGDFDPDVSDVDVLVVTHALVDAQEFATLDGLHEQLVAQYPDWENRIETIYMPGEALRNFKTTWSRIAVMSPGEPFHYRDAGPDWLLNWHGVREQGRVLYGPPASTVIPPITEDEVQQTIRDRVHAWATSVVETRHSRPAQGFAILTLCRALYAATEGRQTSKTQAAKWATARLPGWAPLIRDALAWRRDFRNTETDPEATYPETARFVQDIVRRIEGS